MTDRHNDVLLIFGKTLALILQGLCALAGGIVLLVIPIVIMLSQGLLEDLVGADGNPTIEASPLSVVAILVMICVILAAMFSFFGKMRAIIRSVGAGDPFVPENARRLNAMAWLLLAVEVLAVMVGALRLHLANLVSGTANHLDASIYDLDGVIMVLVLFILARVFRHGAAMREDLEGTV